MKKNIKKIFWLYFSLFFILILNLFKISIYDSRKIINNSYNPRMKETEDTVIRGNILDSKNEILAQSVYTEQGNKREYKYPEQFAHVIGFNTKGKSGVELKYNFNLQKPDNEIIQRIKNILNKDVLKGNDMVLTIDKDVQNYVYKKLGKLKGSIVVMEPSTGKILAMISYPTFNPEKIEQNWEQLNSDSENNPLLNRATQGLYPPGSVFKIITAASEIENIADYENINYDCNGFETFEDKTIHCFDSKKHGNVDITKAMAKSCNVYFSHTGIMIGSEKLKQTSERALFNKQLDFALEYNKSSFSLNQYSDTAEIVETSIGQGKTLVTPLHMAMITSAIANNGIIMKPYIADYFINSSGKIIDKTIPEINAQAFSSDTASKIKQMMEEVITNGTAAQASLKNIKIAGKTGTAQNSSGKDHSWFVAFAPSDSPEVAISIIIENSGNHNKAVPIARDIIKYIIENKE